MSLHNKDIGSQYLSIQLDALGGGLIVVPKFCFSSIAGGGT